MEIYTKDINKEIEGTFGLTGIEGLKIKYELICSLDGDQEFYEDLKAIKKGLKMKFDIRLVLNGYVIEKPENNMVVIRRKIRKNIYEYWDELEERERLIKDILRMCYEGDFDKQSEINISGYDDE